MHFASRFTFGVVAPASEPDRRVVLADFCAALGDAVGASIRPHLSPSAHALASAAHAGRVHLAFLPPLAVARSLLEPIAVAARAGSVHRHAAVFVAQGSPIRSPDDLRGARIAWVASTSACGYLWPRAELFARGFVSSEFFSSESFVGSHDAVARAVADREADAGATWVVFAGGDPALPIAHAGFRRDGRGDAQIVLRAGPIPGDVLSGSSRVSVPLRRRLVRALNALAASPGTREAIAALFRADGFEPASRTTLHALESLRAGA